MNANATELQPTGMRERRRARIFKSQSVRRGGILAAVLSVAALVSSCVSQGSSSDRPITELSTGSAVIAVRLGEGKSVSGLQKPLDDNVIALLDERGQVEAVHLKAKDGIGGLLWTERGISYGGPAEEYLTTASGTQVLTVKERYGREQLRTSLPDGGIAVVTEMLPNGHSLEIIQPDGRVDRTQTSGTEGVVGHCGSRILEVTDTKRSEDIASVAYEAYAAQSGGGNQPEVLDVLVQLDDPDGDRPRLVGVAPKTDGLWAGHGAMSCDGDVVTVPSTQLYDTDASSDDTPGAWRGAFVLQRWDLATGERTIIPVVDEDGNAIELERDHDMIASQVFPAEGEQRFVNEDGRVLSVDLASGQARHLFTTSWKESDAPVLVQLNETGIYFLKVRKEDYAVTLSYQPWDGGDSREIFTTDKLAEYIKTNNIFSGHVRAVLSFAVRPGWNGGAQ